MPRPMMREDLIQRLEDFASWMPYGDWGVSEATPMIVTPPPEEVAKALQEKKTPITSRRIAILEPSPYVHYADCLTFAKAMVFMHNMLPQIIGYLKGETMEDK